MKLQKLTDDVLRDSIHIQDLRDALGQAGCAELRPCAGCDRPCPCSSSATCACSCGVDCSDAPAAMSSDGARYPIEGKIVPLVYHMNSLQVCDPYWSCEGHQLSGNRLSKVPQVWFYARSLMYPKLIAEQLARLRRIKTIHNAWHVCVTYAEENLQTGFSILPDMALIEKPSLSLMQQDVNVIAESLVPGFRTIASEYINRYESDDRGSANSGGGS